MPVYEYRHLEQRGEGCTEVFEIYQKITDDRLQVCPVCGHPVERLLFAAAISTPHTNAELKNLGFTKLVKRDDGVYENVTRTKDEKRYMKRDDPTSLPDIKSKITD
ncbi:MAG: hypothetical protein PWP23_2213 [Candidatus Sumerlaeota bacterium]|nr:hypothetical protein [Candidatus Sumerlaeota bacterium]